MYLTNVSAIKQICGESVHYYYKSLSHRSREKRGLPDSMAESKLTTLSGVFLTCLVSLQTRSSRLHGYYLLIAWWTRRSQSAPCTTSPDRYDSSPRHSSVSACAKRRKTKMLGGSVGMQYMRVHSGHFFGAKRRNFRRILILFNLIRKYRSSCV